MYYKWDEIWQDLKKEKKKLQNDKNSNGVEKWGKWILMAFLHARKI